VKAVLYAAKSTEDKHGSIPTQLADGRLLAERDGLEVVGEYEDEAASAYSGNRGRGLADALTHAERIEGALIVQHSDRLARGDGKQARHLIELVLEARRAGITLRSTQDDATFDNLVMAVVMGERNFEDSRRKGAAVKAGQERRRARGGHIGNPPLGYRLERNADDERVLVPDAGAAIVRRIYTEFLAGRPQLAIARGLSADGLRGGRGGRWYQGTVRRILTNPLYAGWVQTGEELVDALHEPIIERATWRSAQELLESSKQSGVKGRTPTRHLFRGGMLVCGQCGGSMIPRTDRKRETYACFARRADSSACSMPSIERTQVDEAVFSYFAKAALDLEATREQLATAIDHQVADAESLLDGAEREAQSARDRLARVKADYLAGELKAGEWRELREELEPDLAATEAERRRLTTQLADARAGTSAVDAEAGVLEALARIREAVAGGVRDAEGVEAVRAALLKSFDGFVLHHRPPAHALASAFRIDGEDDEAARMELLKSPPGEESGRWIIPRIKEEVLDSYVGGLYPVLVRKPLEMAANNYASSRTEDYLFAPIEVGA
jgi:site-specific DNA recombinase